MNERFGHASYLVRKKILQVFGATFEVFDPTGQLVFYSKQKAFKLKEDIRLYTGEEMQTEVLVIKARQIIDFAGTYDVYDSASGEHLGALQRHGLKSLLKDEWFFLNQHDQEIGVIKEDSTFLALFRRFIFSLIPQTYQVTLGGRSVGTFKQNINPFVVKIQADLSADPEGTLDRRLAMAAAILLCAIEGKQQ